MSKLFKKIPASEKRRIRYEIMLSEVEAVEIRKSASIRNLSVAEFMRRTALGKRADVRFDTEIVLSLRAIVQAIRQLHSTFTLEGQTILEISLGQLIDEAMVAMKRISK
jgi:hypothetical protein